MLSLNRCKLLNECLEVKERQQPRLLVTKTMGTPERKRIEDRRIRLGDCLLLSTALLMKIDEKIYPRYISSSPHSMTAVRRPWIGAIVRNRWPQPSNRTESGTKH